LIEVKDNFRKSGLARKHLILIGKLKVVFSRLFLFYRLIMQFWPGLKNNGFFYYYNFIAFWGRPAYPPERE
jgi:hypothetical protein